MKEFQASNHVVASDDAYGSPVVGTIFLLYIVPVVLIFNHSTDNITYFTAGWWIKTCLERDLFFLRAPTILEKDLF